MSAEFNGVYQFGGFSFNSAERVLRRDGEVSLLSPKQSELLALLLESAPNFVTKKEIFDKLWADTFVEDGVLTQNIYTLRKILGKRPDGVPLIENKTRFGYRISVPVDCEVADESAADVDPKTSVGAVGQTGPRRFRPVVLTGLAVLVCAAAVFLVDRYFFAKATITYSRLERFRISKVTDSGDIEFPIISPDGNFAAYARSPGTDEGGLFVKDLKSDTETKVNISNVKRYGFFRFSSDGSQLFVRNRASGQIPADVLKVSRFGGEAVKIAENVWGGFSLANDEREIFFARLVPEENRFVLIRRTLSDSSEKEVLSISSPESLQLLVPPTVSQDGRKLAVVVNRPGDTLGRIVVVDLDSGAANDLKFSSFRQVASLAWLPNGNSFVVSASQGKFYQIWQVSAADGSAEQVTSGVSNYFSLSVSDDGKRLLTTVNSSYANLWLIGDEGGNTDRQLTFGNSDQDGRTGIDQLPNGQIVFSSNAGDDGSMNIWRLDPSSGERRQLTSKAGRRNEYPVATPDGKSIFFVSDRSGNTVIWKIGANGEDPAQFTFPEGGSDSFPQISPDGSWIYFIRRTGKTAIVMRKSIADGAEQVLTESGKILPANFLSLSPDGSRLAFQDLTDKIRSDDVRQFHRVVVLNTQNPGELSVLNVGGRIPRIVWMADGRGFDFISPGSGLDEIRRRLQSESETSTILRQFQKEALLFHTRTRDQQSLLVSRGRYQNDAVLITDFD